MWGRGRDHPSGREASQRDRTAGLVAGLRTALSIAGQHQASATCQEAILQAIRDASGRLSMQTSPADDPAAAAGSEPRSPRVPEGTALRRAEAVPEGHCWRIRARVQQGVAVFLNEYGIPSSRDVLGTYEPLAEADLLRRFTTLDCTDDRAVESFYEEFGPLTFPAAWHEPSGLPFDGFRLRGEPVWWLEQEACDLRLLLDLRATQQNDDAGKRWRGLRRILARLPRDGWTYDSALFDPAEDRIAVPRFLRLPDGSHMPVAEELPGPQCERLAYDMLKACIDYRLRGLRRVVGAVPAHTDEVAAGGSAPGTYAPRWRFSCLRDALYLQLYDIVTKDERLRVCRCCGHAFVWGKQLRGRPRDHCTDRCRYTANKRSQRSGR